ncbi:Acetyl-CoA acetyltransferase [Chromobacterium violaceum]|uniref:Acetyl-CoA acetyltransferase n=1 Tax=Chromobacterium violaceum TaxID=536 RepID=A0A447TF90_CHRVL|nr:Acetyl-CoA acetyltransferase [Chromobacterium violaceum]
MSLSPHILPGSRDGFRMGNAQLVDTMVNDGLTDAYNAYHMGITAENVAAKYGIGREEQDAFSLQSQQRAAAAQKAGKFRDEIVPVLVPQRKGDPLAFDADEFIKHDASADGLAKLRPAFKKDGTVTAGNASGINDGAAAVLLMSTQKADQLGLKPLAIIKGYALTGCEPESWASAGIRHPQGAVQGRLDGGRPRPGRGQRGLRRPGAGVAKELGWGSDKVNVNGGAIALGHPIGASGCRVLVTLLHEMQRRGAKKAWPRCASARHGVALAVERP